MEQLTVYDVLTIYNRINSNVIPIEIAFFMKKKFIDFNRSWEKQAQEWGKKVDDLYREHYVFDENNQIKTEDVFENKTTVIPKKYFWNKDKTVIERVKTGTKDVLTGKYTQEEFNKKKVELLGTVLKSW